MGDHDEWDDEDGWEADEGYFREICEELLDAHSVEWFRDGGGGGKLELDLRTGAYVLSGFEREWYDPNEDEDDDWDDDEDEASDEEDEDDDSDEEGEWQEVPFKHKGTLPRSKYEDDDYDDDEEVILAPNGQPVLFPAYVRLGHVQVIVEFDGCADEGDIGEVWFLKEGEGGA